MNVTHPGKKAPEQSTVVSRAPLRETNHPATRARDRAVCWTPARYSRLPGQAWQSALGPVWRWRQHPRGAAPPHLHPQMTWTHPPMLWSTSYPRMAHRMKCWAPRGTDQWNHPGTRRAVLRCVRSKRSVGACPAERLLLSPSDLPERQPVVLCSSQRTEHGWRQRVPIFQKGKVRSLQSHAHVTSTGAWVIHECIFSMLEAQTLKTTIVSVIRGQGMIATRRTRTKRHLEKDAIIRDLLF